MRKALFALPIGLALNAAADDQKIHISPEQIDNLAIKTGPMQANSRVPVLHAPARVVVPAQHEALVSSPQPGLLTHMLVNSGDTVKAGQVVAHIISPELVALQQQFLTASSDLTLSQQERHRDHSLLQEGVIAERRWQETQAEYSGKASENNEARQLLEMAGMSAAEINALAQHRKMSQQLNIRAPIDGVVLERMIGNGQRLDNLTPLFRVANLDRLWLEINIPQEKLTNVNIGDRVVIEDMAVTGSIVLLGQSVNPENQTVLARALIDGKQASLKVGQSVNIQIVQPSAKPAFKVPNSAVAQSEGQNYLFVRGDKGFSVLPVQVIGKQDAETILSGDLNGNESVAIKGAAALKANWLGLGGSEE